MSEILVQSMSPKLNIVIVGMAMSQYLKVINDLKNINISHIFQRQKKILKKKRNTR